MTQEIINTIDGIQVTLNAGGMNTINIILAFVMYGVALGIKPQIFVEVFKKPKSVLLGILCQLVGVYQVSPETGFYSLLPQFKLPVDERPALLEEIGRLDDNDARQWLTDLVNSWDDKPLTKHL